MGRRVSHPGTARAVTDSMGLYDVNGTLTTFDGTKRMTFFLGSMCTTAGHTREPNGSVAFGFAAVNHWRVAPKAFKTI